MVETPCHSVSYSPMKLSTLDSLSPFVRAYLEAALALSHDETYFARKAAMAAGYSVHSEMVDGVEKWVTVSPGENGADYIHEIEFESDAWRAAAEWIGAGRQDDTPLDRDFSVTDFSPAGLARALADCEKFLSVNAATLALAIEGGEINCQRHEEMSLAGSDFWLTRNHHGAGFWESDWPEWAGRALTESAHGFGELSAYIDENGQVSFE
jgi:hypothetical protein